MKSSIGLSSVGGYTLVELIVVMMIVGILANIAAVQLGNYAVKVRDAKRRADARSMVQALNDFYIDHNTFAISGSGFNDTGVGWFGYEGANYNTAISKYLYNNNYITRPIVDDPDIASRPNYLYWCCGTNCTGGFTIFLALEQPTLQDSAHAAAVCGGDLYGPSTAFNKTFAMP